MNRKKREELENPKTRTMTETREPKDLPLPWEFWTILPLAVLYGVARVYLFVEAFLGLRIVEATALLNVDWASYFSSSLVGRESVTQILRRALSIIDVLCGQHVTTTSNNRAGSSNSETVQLQGLAPRAS